MVHMRTTSSMEKPSSKKKALYSSMPRIRCVRMPKPGCTSMSVPMVSGNTPWDITSWERSQPKLKSP